MTVGARQGEKADLYVCDLDGASRRLPESVEPAQCIVLVDRDHLPSYWQVAAASFLVLKPVTKTRFAILLEQAIAYRRRLASGEALRADREQLLQMLLYTNLKLQQYDQDRTNFLARAVHDFRAPLTSMMGYCSLLLRGSLGAVDPEQGDVIERMQRSIKRLSRMTSAMFQLSVGHQMQIEVRGEVDDIVDCIEHCAEEMAPQYEEKRISVSLQTAPPERPLYFERERLEQVLINLLDNACRFTAKSGSVYIAGYPYFYERRRSKPLPGGYAAGADRRRQAAHGNNAYRVDIRDTGPGIPPERLETIFEEYTSYSGGTDRSGAGLGLAICRLIVNQHQGRIWAESGSNGATFSFVLFNSQQPACASARRQLEAAIPAR